MRRAITWLGLSIVGCGGVAGSDPADAERADLAVSEAVSADWRDAVPTGTASVLVPMEEHAVCSVEMTGVQCHRYDPPGTVSVKLEIVRTPTLTVHWKIAGSEGARVAPDGTFSARVAWRGDGTSGTYGLAKDGFVDGVVHGTGSAARVLVTRFEFVETYFDRPQIVERSSVAAAASIVP